MATSKKTWKRRLQGTLFKMPLMISCKEFENFIVDYIEGTLDNRRRRLFEFHIKLCTECREYLAAYKAGMEAARQGLADDESPVPDEVPEDLVAAVIASQKSEN